MKAKIPNKCWPHDSQCIKCGSENLSANGDACLTLTRVDGRVHITSFSTCGDQEYVMQCLDCGCKYKHYYGSDYPWTDGPCVVNEGCR